MITDFDSNSSPPHATLDRAHSRQSSTRFEAHTTLKDEANSIYTQSVLYPAVQPSQAFPWFTAVLDGLSEPLSRYHE
jgi:hypothetical protein